LNRGVEKLKGEKSEARSWKETKRMIDRLIVDLLNRGIVEVKGERVGKPEAGRKLKG
jgi:hypothetical protein